MAIESPVPAWLQPYYNQQGLFGTTAPTNYGSRTVGAEGFFSSLPSYTYSNLVSQQPVSYQQTLPYTQRRRSFDTNAPSIEDIEAELGLAGTMEPTLSNALAIGRNLVSFTLNPVGFFTTLNANLALNKNKVELQSIPSLVSEAFTDIEPGTAAWDAAIASLAEGVSEEEAEFGIDYSGEVGGYNDPDISDFAATDFSPGYGGYAGSEDMGGFDFGDMSDFSGDYGGTDVSDGTDGGSGGSGGGDGGDSGTYICTAAFKAGISPKERFRQNKKYGIKMRREDPVLMRGYDIVGPWIAKKIGHTKLGNALTKLYAKKASGEKLSTKQKVLDTLLNITSRPAIKLVGRFS